MNIYIDATGGDNAPDEIVKGAINASRKYNVPITLIGKIDIIKSVIEKNGLSCNDLSFINATQLIEMVEEPVKAVRTKKDSALVIGAKIIKNDMNSVFISAGSTGAVLTAGTLICGRLNGVKRPALATVLPGETPTLLIDNGANADCKAEFFPVFAKMGNAYMKALFGEKEYSIGLLNIGVEEVKGNQLYKEAYTLLKNDESLNFIGNVETKELFKTSADILVCDGFTGNMVLKSIEGSLDYTLSILKKVFTKNIINKIAAVIIKKDIAENKKVMDPSYYGGVPLLGIDGNIIKAHGNSNAQAIENAVRQAIELIKNKSLEKIIQSLKN